MNGYTKMRNEEIHTWNCVGFQTSLLNLLKSSTMIGRIHTNFVAHSCTGRIHTTHPNVQNVQKEAVIDGCSVRSLFIAARGISLSVLNFS